MAFLIMVPHQLGAAVSPNNPNLKILSFYDTVFEQQKSLLTLAIAENSIANQFHSVGVPSLAPLDNIADGVYKRVGGSVGSVLLPGWEKLIESWVHHLQPSLDNGTTAGVFLGDESAAMPQSAAGMGCLTRWRRNSGQCLGRRKSCTSTSVALL